MSSVKDFIELHLFWEDKYLFKYKKNPSISNLRKFLLRYTPDNEDRTIALEHIERTKQVVDAYLERKQSMYEEKERAFLLSED